MLKDLNTGQRDSHAIRRGDGHRGAIFVVDVADPSKVPQLAEPFYLVFNALAKFRVCMTPEDLGRSGLDAIGRKYA